MNDSAASVTLDPKLTCDGFMANLELDQILTSDRFRLTKLSFVCNFSSRVAGAGGIKLF